MAKNMTSRHTAATLSNLWPAGTVRRVPPIRPADSRDARFRKEPIVTRTSRMIPAALVLLATASLAAQEAVQPPPNPRTAEPVSLKVSLVFARYQGDKKISSVPHVLWVTANQNRTSLRMGTQIPVPTILFGKEGE